MHTLDGRSSQSPTQKTAFLVPSRRWRKPSRSSGRLRRCWQNAKNIHPHSYFIWNRPACGRRQQRHRPTVRAELEQIQSIVASMLRPAGRLLECAAVPTHSRWNPLRNLETRRRRKKINSSTKPRKRTVRPKAREPTGKPRCARFSPDILRSERENGPRPVLRPYQLDEAAT